MEEKKKIITPQDRLYERVCDENEAFERRMASRPPEEIIANAYYISERQNIVFALQTNDVTDEQALALLRLPEPLESIAATWEHNERLGEDALEAVEKTADLLLEADERNKRGPAL